MGVQSKEWGQQAEKIAQDYLVGKGYPIRETNWSPVGGHKEIDIISQNDKKIIFVEVKARSGDYQDPVDAVDTKKLRNLARCANSYLESLPEDFWEYRFDIIAIYGNAEKYDIVHIEDAFLGPLITFR